jgi:hypothetical protein
MDDAMMFDRSQDTSIFGGLLYSQSSKPRLVVIEEKAPYLIQSTGTVNNTDLWRLEEMFMEFQQMAWRVQAYEAEIPDVFDLRPLSSQRVMLKIREVKPASFYFVSGNDDEE